MRPPTGGAGSLRRRLREVANGARAGGAGRDWELPAASVETPFDSMQRREVRMALECGLRELDERLRQAVVLRDIEGLAYNEIAETLGIAPGTVKSRILRGREALKKRLQHRLPALAPKGWSLQME